MSDNRQGGRGNGNERRPSDLGQKVDWMTYSHQALYDMIHQGVDLKAAGSAQADWTLVGKSLAEVHELLVRAISRAQQAWSGASADRAREALESVEKWALHTSDHAENVAKCIGDEIQHVQTAREMMPAPAPAPPVVEPVDTAVPVSPVPRSPMMADRRAFAEAGYEEPVSLDGLRARTPVTSPTAPTSPFADIDRIGAPAVDSVLTADASHRQAAEVMAMFQQNSYQVDRTVPSFAPPPNPIAPPPSTPPVVVGTGPGTPPAGDGGTAVVGGPANQPSPSRDATTPQQGRGAGGRGGHVPGRGGLPLPVMGAGAGGAGGGGAPALGSPGSAPGVAGQDRTSNAHPGGVTSQFSSPKSVTPQHGMIGAAPMAAPPPVAPSSGSNERNRPGYLEEEDNVFGVDRKAAPPVIGL